MSGDSRTGLPWLPRRIEGAVLQLLRGRALPPSAHAGLVWERYAGVWNKHRIPADSQGRKGWMVEFSNNFNAAGGNRKQDLEARLARLRDLSDDSRVFQCQSPLLLGAGAEHPTENGFAFDPILGVPVLPGSSVKGVARAGAVLLDIPESDQERVLGSEHPNRLPEARQVDESPLLPGSVCFFDAWPAAWPRLTVDILNPHHPDTYRDHAANPAGERNRVADYTEEPVPVPFLVVATGTSFQFFLRARGRKRPVALRSSRAADDAVGPSVTAGNEKPDSDLASAWTWLEAGLKHLGIGAKTAAGYGHMA